MKRFSWGRVINIDKLNYLLRTEVCDKCENGKNRHKSGVCDDCKVFTVKQLIKDSPMKRVVPCEECKKCEIETKSGKYDPYDYDDIIGYFCKMFKMSVGNESFCFYGEDKYGRK